MRIGLLAPLCERVPPLLHGGTERTVATRTKAQPSKRDPEWVAGGNGTVALADGATS